MCSLRTLHATSLPSHHSSLIAQDPKTCPFVLLNNIRRRFRVDGHPELVSGSVRGERQEKARGEMLKRVQHDIWSHLLFILSFWDAPIQFFCLIQKLTAHGSQLTAQNVKKNCFIPLPTFPDFGSRWLRSHLSLPPLCHQRKREGHNPWH